MIFKEQAVRQVRVRILMELPRNMTALKTSSQYFVLGQTDSRHEMQDCVRCLTCVRFEVFLQPGAFLALVAPVPNTGNEGDYGG
jgi:hypothetical protein